MLDLQTINSLTAGGTAGVIIALGWIIKTYLSYRLDLRKQKHTENQTINDRLEELYTQHMKLLKDHEDLMHHVNAIERKYEAVKSLLNADQRIELQHLENLPPLAYGGRHYV